jgi:hypothetical protein
MAAVPPRFLIIEAVHPVVVVSGRAPPPEGTAVSRPLQWAEVARGGDRKRGEKNHLYELPQLERQIRHLLILITVPVVVCSVPAAASGTRPSRRPAHAQLELEINPGSLEHLQLTSLIIWLLKPVAST